MSSPPAAEDAPVRSERPKLNLKPRDEGAAAKLASERAAAAKSVSFFLDLVMFGIRRESANRAAGRKNDAKASTLVFRSFYGLIRV